MLFAGRSFAASAFAAYDVADASNARTAIAPLVTDGDTTRDAEGNLLDAADPIDQEVAFYLATGIGSFFGDNTIGNGVYRMRVRTNTTEVEVRDHARRALRFMLERGDIANLTITPKPTTTNGLARNYYLVTYHKTGIVRR